MHTLRRNTTQALIELFEAYTELTPSMDGQLLEGITYVEKARCLTEGQSKELNGWLKKVGYAGIYEATYDFEPEAVDLVEEDDPNVMRYRCPETGMWERVPLEETAVYQVDRPRLINGLADLLEIPMVLRQGIEQPAIPDVLWALGTARLDNGLHLPVFVVRRLGHHLDKVIDTLEAMKTPGIMLSSSHGKRKAVLDRTARIERFHLDIHVDMLGSKPMQFDDRGAANRIKDVVIDRHKGILLCKKIHEELFSGVCPVDIKLTFGESSRNIPITASLPY